MSIGVGQFVLVVLDAEGRALEERELVCFSGHPVVGEEIELQGTVFRVERVRHELVAGDRSRKKSTVPRVFVVRDEAAETTTLGMGLKGRPSPILRLRIKGKPGPYGGDVGSAILPRTLVALLVGVGYHQQAALLREQRLGLRVFREGQRWHSDTLSPDELLRLADKAEKYFGFMVDLLPLLTDGERDSFEEIGVNRVSLGPSSRDGAVATSDSRHGAPPALPPEERAPSPSPVSRPAPLRLVRRE